VLNTNHVGLLLASLELLLDLAAKRTYATKLSAKGCVRILMTLLAEGTDPTLCLPTLRLLQPLCVEENLKKIHGEGCVACIVVKPLISHLSQGFAHLPPADIPTARTTAISILGTMARSTEYAEDIQKSGGVEVFCQLLKSSTPQDPAATAIATGMANLAVSGDIRVMIAEMDGLPLVVNLLRHGLPATKSQALRAISNLAINKDNQVAIMKLGVIPEIVELLRDPAICDHAVSALQALVYNEAKAQEIAVAAQAIPLLINMIKSGSATGKARAALAIFFLVQQKTHQDLAAASIPLLVELITNEDETCKINAIKALGALALENSTNQATLVTKGGIAKTIQCLTKMKSAREGVTKAIGKFTGSPTADNAIIENSGLKALITVMDGTDSEKVEAIEALALLLGSLFAHNRGTGPPKHLDPFLNDFIDNMPGYVMPTLTTMLTNPPNLHAQLQAILLLQFLCTFGYPLPSNLPLPDLINAGGSSALHGMRLVEHMFKEQPDLSPKILEPAISGLIAASNNTDPNTHESQQLATQLLVHLLADPGLVATIAPQIDIPRVVEEFARTEQPHALRAAADAIWCLLECNMQWEVAVAQAGGIRPCVRLLSSKDDDLLRPALSALRILAFAYADDLARDEGVGLLLGIVMEQNDVQLIALAAQALWVMLVSGSKLAREMLVSEGGVDVLVELIERDSVGTQVKLYAEQSLYLLRSGIYLYLQLISESKGGD
jgi:vacuolar protein 8